MPEDKKAKETSANALAWLVNSRNRIQDVLLLLDQNPNKPDGREWQNNIAIAFSLWRAVFLCHDAEDLDRKLEPDARQFLRKVIETNAIGFVDDVKSRAWTGGYYINNALSRLNKTTYRRPRHGSQRNLWDSAFQELDKRVKESAR